MMLDFGTITCLAFKPGVWVFGEWIS